MAKFNLLIQYGLIQPSDTIWPNTTFWYNKYKPLAAYKGAIGKYQYIRTYVSFKQTDSVHFNEYKHVNYPTCRQTLSLLFYVY